MKTKINEVPLVGPRGRKELLAKINELEEKIASLREENTELVERVNDLEVDTQPRTLILNETDITDTTSEVLDTMELNGEVPTFNELKNLDIRNTVVQVDKKKLQILCLSSSNNSLSITAGYYLGSDGAFIVSIELSMSENGSISLLEL